MLLRAAELALEGRDLVGTQAPDPAGLGDGEPFHDLLGPDLPDARQGLEQSRDLHLADYVVLLALVHDLGERGSGVLEPVLDLGTLTPGRGCLLQGGRALFGSEGAEEPRLFTS